MMMPMQPSIAVRVCPANVTADRVIDLLDREVASGSELVLPCQTEVVESLVMDLVVTPILHTGSSVLMPPTVSSWALTGFS